MGQIRGKKPHISACNIRSLSSFGIPYAGMHILVSTDNSATEDGQGNFDAYVVGDGNKAATALPLKEIVENTIYKQVEVSTTKTNFINGTSGKWQELFGGYWGVIQPLEEGKKYKISTGNNTLAIAILESNTTTPNTLPDYSSSHPARIVLAENSEYIFSADNESKYLFIFVMVNSVSKVFTLSDGVSLKEVLIEVADNYVSTEAQSFTDLQMKQARANLGFGNGDVDEVPVKNSSNAIKSGGVYGVYSDVNGEEQNYVRGHYITAQNAVGDSSSFDYFDYIVCNGGDTVVWSTGSTSTAIYLVFLNSDKSTVLDYWQGTSSGIRTVTAPANTAWVRGSLGHAGRENAYLKINGVTVWEATDTKIGLNDRVDALTEGLQNVTEEADTCYDEVFGDLNYVEDFMLANDNTGALIPQVGYCVSEKIDATILRECSPNNKEIYYGTLGSNSQIAFVEYGENDSFVDKASGAGLTHRVLVLNEDTKYIRICFQKGYESKIVHTFGFSLETIWKAGRVNGISDNPTIKKIPSYYKDLITNKERTISELDASCGNGDSFIFITDMHVECNCMNSPQLIRHIVENSNVKKVFNGGDLLDYGYQKISVIRKIREWFNMFPTIRQFVTIGNHDFNSAMGVSAKYMSNAELYGMLLRDAEAVADTEGKNYYYIDNVSQKIRYFFLDAHWNGATDTRGVSLDYDAQLSWMESKAAEVGAEWSIIVLQHIIYEPS